MVSVYRNSGEYGGLDLRPYRSGKGDAALAIIGELSSSAPQEYARLWAGTDILLDSTYAYANHPSAEELAPMKRTVYTAADAQGKLLPGTVVERKDNWLELDVDPRRCIVAPHLLAGDILLQGKKELIPQYWAHSMPLEEFLQDYSCIGARSDADWQRSTGEIYRLPEVIIPLDAVKGISRL